MSTISVCIVCGQAKECEIVRQGNLSSVAFVCFDPSCQSLIHWETHNFHADGTPGGQIVDAVPVYRGRKMKGERISPAKTLDYATTK